MKESNSEESILALDLSPKPGMNYFHSSRPWEEEIIYFLLVDRFHDGKDRSIMTPEGRVKGFGTKHQLKSVYGGNISGIIKELDYIVNLGCTSIWLSPLFENNIESYHGYSIQNFLKVDPRFGTKEELIQLIKAAHNKGLKVFLDCVINHSGNNWNYKGNTNPAYDKGKQFEFGEWKSNSILPIELRNVNYYHRKGHVNNWDEFPETQEGDFFSLKKFNHSETKDGLALQEAMVKIYAYWIRELDCDGFRMDAAKHLGELPVARFSTRIKEYARNLGKKDFFIFTEISGDDAVLNKFSKSIYSKLENENYHPADSHLDFPLHYNLPKVVLSKVSPARIFNRYKSLQHFQRELLKRDFPLVTFLDNHDQIESGLKERIGARCNDKQLVAALGLLFTLPGVPCLYYGTEQGFRGFGDDDALIREGMFSKEEKSCAHNQNTFIYKEIATLLRIRKEHRALLAGTINDLSIENIEPGEPVFFSRSDGEKEIFVVYNPDQENNQLIEFPERVAVSSILFLYGELPANKFIKERGKIKAGLILPPLQFSIFKVD